MLLKLIDIHKAYPSVQSDNIRHVLNGVSLDIESGESIAILGPSGSGKSTLLNIIGTLDKSDSGEIIFDGNKLENYSEKQLSRFRNQHVGFVFQSHHLLPQCSVIENVLVPTLPLKDPKLKKDCHSRALELIGAVGLVEQKDNLPGTLSGGECQRVAVIRALINKPKLLLADEPTGSLDRQNALTIISLLKQLNTEYNTSLILVTHSHEIGSGMEKKYELKDGQLIQI